jgi:AbrB family looped-hinge helix DNA binding protein
MMSTTLSVKVDAKGRLSIPGSLRKELDIQPGDTLFVQIKDGMLRYAKAENPFDTLVEHALAERLAGRTRRLRNFAEENEIDLDAE